MLNKKILIYSFILFGLTLSSCKKDTHFNVEDVTCSIDHSDHSDHTTYQAILDQYTQEGVVGLTVVVSKPGTEDWIGSSGYANIEDNLKMNPCHLHHTASLAKSFTGIVTLQLIEEGKLNFDDPIGLFLSDEIKSYIPNVDQLTIKHLLQQNSGIPDVFDVAFFQTLMNDPEQTYTNEDFLAMIEGRPAMFEPGEKHYYSDLNYNLLAMIINAIEGDHHKSFQDRIFTPLNLSDVYYHNGSYPEPEGLVASYWDQYDNGEIENVSELQVRMTDYIEGSDGIISSPKDMTRFYQAVFNGELVGPEMLDLIRTEWEVETDENRMNTGYSHGFMVVEAEDGNWIGHAGSHIGVSCFVFHNIDTGVTLSAFTNTGVHFFVEKKALIYYYLWNDLREAL